MAYESEAQTYARTLLVDGSVTAVSHVVFVKSGKRWHAAWSVRADTLAARNRHASVVHQVLAVEAGDVHAYEVFGGRRPIVFINDAHKRTRVKPWTEPPPRRALASTPAALTEAREVYEYLRRRQFASALAPGGVPCVARGISMMTVADPPVDVAELFGCIIHLNAPVVYVVAYAAWVDTVLARARDLLAETYHAEAFAMAQGRANTGAHAAISFDDDPPSDALSAEVQAIVNGWVDELVHNFEAP